MMKLSTEYHMWNITATWWVPNRFWNNKTNKTLVIWQDSRIRCNTCIDLQSRGSSSCRETDRVISHYVEKRSHPSRIQGCNNYPPTQKERESSSLWQSSMHLFIVTIIDACLYCQLLGRVLLNRLNEQLEQSGLLPESQCGSRKDRGTIDMIFTARQLQEKCQE